MTIKQEIVEHLRELANGEIDPVFEDAGICCELFTKFDTSNRHLYNIFKLWPKFSGQFGHPIGLDLNNPFKLYMDACSSSTMWGESAYTDQRRELCDFMADTIEEFGFQ